jgi:hypothetical protein
MRAFEVKFLREILNLRDGGAGGGYSRVMGIFIICIPHQILSGISEMTECIAYTYIRVYAGRR